MILKGQVQGYIIVDYSRDYTVVNDVLYFFQFFSFNLRNYIFQFAKKCEMTSFSMISFHVDLNEPDVTERNLTTLNRHPPLLCSNSIYKSIGFINISFTFEN